MDLDFAAGIVRMLLKSKSRYSIMDALNNVQRLDASYWKAIVSNGIPHLEVLGGPSEVYPPEAANADATLKQAKIAAAMSRAQLSKARSAFGATPNDAQRAQLHALEAAAEQAQQRLDALLAGPGHVSA